VLRCPHLSPCTRACTCGVRDELWHLNRCQTVHFYCVILLHFEVELLALRDLSYSALVGNFRVGSRSAPASPWHTVCHVGNSDMPSLGSWKMLTPVLPQRTLADRSNRLARVTGFAPRYFCVVSTPLASCISFRAIVHNSILHFQLRLWTLVYGPLCENLLLHGCAGSPGRRSIGGN
jgi:hypothetical protein